MSIRERKKNEACHGRLNAEQAPLPAGSLSSLDGGPLGSNKIKFSVQSVAYSAIGSIEFQ